MVHGYSCTFLLLFFRHAANPTANPAANSASEPGSGTGAIAAAEFVGTTGENAHKLPPMFRFDPSCRL